MSAFFRFRGLFAFTGVSQESAHAECRGRKQGPEQEENQRRGARHVTFGDPEGPARGKGSGREFLTHRAKPTTSQGDNRGQPVVNRDVPDPGVCDRVGSGGTLLSEPAARIRRSSSATRATGTPVEVADEAGVTNLRFSKGGAWGDYDDDRDPDLFVSNQFGLNRFYRNDGGGRFSEIAHELGVDVPKNSFPTWFWDYDNDGLLDLFVASYEGRTNGVYRSYLRPDKGLGLNGLYRNVGDGRFENLEEEAELSLLTLTMGANLGDIDSDGWLDFYLGTGSPAFDAIMPNVMYRGDGHGGFQDVSGSTRTGALQKGHGVSFGDLDDDGDQDVFAQIGGFFTYDAFFNCLFENPGHGNAWITIVAQGVESNRDAIGTRVRITFEEGGVTRDVYRWVGPTGSFGSSSRQLEIGLGRADGPVRVEAYWPKSDITQVFGGVEPNQAYRLVESAGGLEPIARPAFRFAVE